VNVTTSLADNIAQEFAGPWRDESPVFGCCRNAVQIALAGVDIPELLTMSPTIRFAHLAAAVDAVYPDQLRTHRCCTGHVADLAFDLTDLAEAKT
jgi:hypothetical protein